MSLLSPFLDELAKPDGQGRDWYAWAANQTGHAFLGVMVAGIPLVLGAPVWAALVVVAVLAGAKEGRDFVAVPTLDTLMDNVNDFFFWMVGGVLAVALAGGLAGTFGITLAVGGAMLFPGVIQRFLKASV